MLQKVFKMLKFIYLFQRVRKRNKPQNLKISNCGTWKIKKKINWSKDTRYV
jgi:hypothetical protein